MVRLAPTYRYAALSVRKGQLRHQAHHKKLASFVAARSRYYCIAAAPRRCGQAQVYLPKGQMLTAIHSLRLEVGLGSSTDVPRCPLQVCFLPITHIDPGLCTPASGNEGHRGAARWHLPFFPYQAVIFVPAAPK